MLVNVVGKPMRRRNGGSRQRSEDTGNKSRVNAPHAHGSLRYGRSSCIQLALTCSWTMLPNGNLYTHNQAPGDCSAQLLHRGLADDILLADFQH